MQEDPVGRLGGTVCSSLYSRVKKGEGPWGEAPSAPSPNDQFLSMRQIPPDPSFHGCPTLHREPCPKFNFVLNLFQKTVFHAINKQTSVLFSVSTFRLWIMLGSTATFILFWRDYFFLQKVEEHPPRKQPLGESLQYINSSGESVTQGSMLGPATKQKVLEGKLTTVVKSFENPQVL